MAISFDVTGLDELLAQFDQVGRKAGEIAAQGLFDGAGIAADNLTAAINDIQTEPFRYVKDGEKRLPSPEEKAAVQRARHGVARFRHNGTSVQTSIGLQNSGYTKLAGKDSVPIPKIANAINSGTSFMQKQPFLRKAERASRASAQAAIEKKIKEKADELLS